MKSHILKPIPSCAQSLSVFYCKYHVEPLFSGFLLPLPAFHLVFLDCLIFLHSPDCIWLTQRNFLQVLLVFIPEPFSASSIVVKTVAGHRDTKNKDQIYHSPLYLYIVMWLCSGQWNVNKITVEQFSRHFWKKKKIGPSSSLSPSRYNTTWNHLSMNHTELRDKTERTSVRDHMECYSDHGPVIWTLLCQGEINFCLVLSHFPRPLPFPDCPHTRLSEILT